MTVCDACFQGPGPRGNGSLNLLVIIEPGPHAIHARQVAEFPAGGLLFRDNVHVEAFEDPKVASRLQPLFHRLPT